MASMKHSSLRLEEKENGTNSRVHKFMTAGFAWRRLLVVVTLRSRHVRSRKDEERGRTKTSREGSDSAKLGALGCAHPVERRSSGIGACGPVLKVEGRSGNRPERKSMKLRCEEFGDAVTDVLWPCTKIERRWKGALRLELRRRKSSMKT